MIVDRANLDLAFRGFKTVYSEHFDATPSHIDTIAMRVGSNSAEEDYGWLGQFPDLREWIGDRHVKGMKSHGFTIKNKKFESTISVKRDDMADDKFGIYKPLFSEMGRITKQHPDKIAFGLLKDAHNQTCYDRKPFFSVEHPGVDADKAKTTYSNSDSASVGPAWYLLDCSRGIRPLVWQEREKYDFQTVNAANDHHVFMKDEYLYGIRARVNCGLGLWQLAYRSTELLDINTYADARTKMAEYRGDDGQILGITPTHLVVPPAHEPSARQVLKALQIDGTTNVWAGTAELVVSPFLA